MVMVMKTLKSNLSITLTVLLVSILALQLPINLVSAADNSDVLLQVNINEVLSVSLTTPDTWASGDVSLSGDSGLLRNKVGLSVTSNNDAGFSAFMASKNTTNLVNQSKSTSIIPTLASASTAGAFPANYWGYSLDDVDAGSSTANYSAMQTSLIPLENRTAPATVNKDIFFGAKADATVDSGTYANTVIFSVVSGYVDPQDPVVPDTPTPVEPITPGTPTYDSTNDRTVYTQVATGTQTAPVATGTKTTMTTITPGDTTATYTNPHGVTNVSGSPLAAGLAITSATAAATGIFFFILAKRKKDDDDEEEEEEI